MVETTATNGPVHDDHEQPVLRNLRALRFERRMSVRELARKSGVSAGTISYLERGLHRPHPRTSWSLAAALGCSVAELVDVGGTGGRHDSAA